jgi:homocysteine S-methyltransferase
VTGRPGSRGDQIYLTDAGIETDLIFHRGVELIDFAAFPLLESGAGRRVLAEYYRDHLYVAAEHGFGFVFEAPTWRANPDWGRALGYDQAALDRSNESAIAFLSELAIEAEGPSILSGCVGPRSDGYAPTSHMSADQARAYHAPQIGSFERAGADLVNAMTMTYPAEAIGIVLAAVDVALPVAISFTLEQDGRLPDSTTLAEAIGQVDAATDGAAAYFGINCAHPDHIALADLGGDDEWTRRLRALRANASRRSHAELDEANELDEGDPADLAAGYARLRQTRPGLNILGGCCGTDARHITAIASVV